MCAERKFRLLLFLYENKKKTKQKTIIIEWGFGFGWKCVVTNNNAAHNSTTQWPPIHSFEMYDLWLPLIYFLPILVNVCLNDDAISRRRKTKQHSTTASLSLSTESSLFVFLFFLSNATMMLCDYVKLDSIGNCLWWIYQKICSHISCDFRVDIEHWWKSNI